MINYGPTFQATLMEEEALVFEHVLRQCGYLAEFHTVYVMVDNRDLANHQRQDSSLPHWPAAARWWHSRLKLIGPHKEKTELLYSSPFPHLQGYIMCTPPGLAPLYWRCFLGSTSSCWTVIVYLLLCLKLKTCGLRPTWRDFQPSARVAFLRHTHYEPSHVSAKTRRLYTHNLGFAVLEWALVVTEPHAELNAGLFVIFRSSHPPLFDWNAWSLRLRSYRALAVSSVLMRRRSGYNQAWRFRL